MHYTVNKIAERIRQKALKLFDKKYKNTSFISKSFVLEELNTILNGQKLNIIDVGGAVNLQPHYNKLVGNANFFIFEPDKRSYDDLVSSVNRYSHPKDFTYINKALAGKNGMRTLYLSNVPTGTSILKLKNDQGFFSKDSAYFFPMKEMEIETSTLESALNAYGSIEYDAMKLDVQGAELEIIKGLDIKRLSQINVIELEIGVHQIYDDQTKFCDVIEYMNSKGFGLFDLRTNRSHLPNIIDNFSYHEKYFKTHEQSPSISARLWEFDAIFFREPKWIEENSITKERLLRIISMYCVYNFFGEAIQVINKALDAGIITNSEHLVVKNAIVSWNSKEQFNTRHINAKLKSSKFTVWAQYMWTNYPSF